MDEYLSRLGLYYSNTEIEVFPHVWTIRSGHKVSHDSYLYIFVFCVTTFNKKKILS